MITRSARVVATLLSLLALGASVAAAQPQIRKPQPAPAERTLLPPLPRAEIDNKLAIGGDELKARAVDSRLSVDVLLNGRGPYHFIVDSGADTSVVGLGIAKTLALPLGAPALLVGTTARNVVDRVKVGQLTLGSSTTSDLQLPALREVDLGGDGLLGIDTLAQQRVMLDFEKHTIRVEDARVPIKHLPGEIVIIARRQRGQLILAHVKAGPLALDAVIDTGSQLTIGNKALRDKLIRRNHGTFYNASATGVTGVTRNMEVAMIDQLQIGPVTLRNVPVAFADVPPFDAFGLSDGPALLLGTDLLANFRRISLDFRNRKVRFQLRRCAPQDFATDLTPKEAVTVLMPSSTMEVCNG